MSNVFSFIGMFAVSGTKIKEMSNVLGQQNKLLTKAKTAGKTKHRSRIRSGAKYKQ